MNIFIVLTPMDWMASTTWTNEVLRQGSTSNMVKMQTAGAWQKFGDIFLNGRRNVNASIWCTRRELMASRSRDCQEPPLKCEDCGSNGSHAHTTFEGWYVLLASTLCRLSMVWATEIIVCLWLSAILFQIIENFPALHITHMPDMIHVSVGRGVYVVFLHTVVI